MRSRALLFAFMFVAGSLALPAAAHAAIPFFGPIIPQIANQNICPGSWGLIITVINNIITFLITIAIVFVAPIMIAYAGFLLVTGQGNSGSISKARGIITNTVIGIIVALAAWLIVDAVMSVLYNGSLGAWSSIITSGGVGPCLTQKGSLPNDTLDQAAMNQAATPATPGVSATGGTTTAGSGTLSQCSSSNTACSPSALQADGSLNAAQANVMSCLAVTESSGNPSTPPYNTVHPGSDSTACGTFQITRTTWNGAASGACSDFSNCQNAACNLQVAETLVSQSGYSSWTCAGCNRNAASCVQQYGGG